MERQKQIMDLVSGNLDSNQKEKLLREIKNDSRLKGEYERIKNAWALSSLNNEIDSLSVEDSYIAFQKKRDHKKITGKVMMLQVLKYAAIILLIFSLGIYSGQNFLKNMVSAEYNEIHVPNGDKAEITLTDGSKVWLNSGTKLRFPKAFNGNTREIDLSGEAYFEVKKGSAPFIVATSYGDVRVLGTSFNVRAYDNMQFQATLMEGKINFESELGNRILAPGQQLTMTSKKIVINSVNTSYISLWRRGVIAFQSEPLADVVKKLERHFSVKIQLDSQLAGIRFTGKVFDETIYEVMGYINKTKSINYKYDKNQRTLLITKGD